MISYSSADASAPTASMRGPGSLITVLDGCLVNGYPGKAAAGWTKTYSGTNKAVYRANTITGNGFYLRVDDSGTDEATLRGYESMSDVDTGVDPFPTVAQATSGVFVRRSNTLGGAWRVYADDLAFYLSNNGFGTDNAKTSTEWQLAGFGDFVPLSAADAYNTIIFARDITSTSAITAGLTGGIRGAGASWSLAGLYMARDYSGVSKSAACCFAAANAVLTGTVSLVAMGSVGLAYPYSVTSNLMLGRVIVGDSVTGFRGHMPGLWMPYHVRPLTILDTFSGVGDLSAKTFVVEHAKYSSTAGQCFMQTTNWR